MARLLSHPYVTIRGSVAGTTYLANQFHQIVARARTAPVQPNTNPQTSIRAALSGANIRWKDILLPSERDLWEDYALTCQYQGPIGPYTVPGRLIYIAGRSLADYINARGWLVVAAVDTVPSEPGFYALAGIDCIKGPLAPGTGFQVIVNNFGSHDVAALVNCSIPFGETRNRYKGPWSDALTVAANCPAAASTVIDVYTPVADMFYFFRVRGVVNDAGHAITSDFYGRCESGVTAPP
jgi:hypothetical protein